MTELFRYFRKKDKPAKQPESDIGELLQTLVGRTLKNGDKTYRIEEINPLPHIKPGLKTSRGEDVWGPVIFMIDLETGERVWGPLPMLPTRETTLAGLAKHGFVLV